LDPWHGLDGPLHVPEDVVELSERAFDVVFEGVPGGRKGGKEEGRTCGAKMRPVDNKPKKIALLSEILKFNQSSKCSNGERDQSNR